MIEVRIILKSGAEIQVECSDWKIQKHWISGKLIDYEFTDCKPRLPYLELEEVAAIIRQ